MSGRMDVFVLAMLLDFLALLVAAVSLNVGSLTERVESLETIHAEESQ